MPVERSAGAVIFRKEADKPLFLLLYYPSISHRADKNYWDFPKGHIEKEEKAEEAAKREAEEETGLKDIRIVEGFKELVKYFFKFKEKNILEIRHFLFS